jgi:hypothetical protein
MNEKKMRGREEYIKRERKEIERKEESHNRKGEV